jgi:hypothetical protein
MSGLTGQRFFRLPTAPVFFLLYQAPIGAPGETRTPNPQIRSLVLYPIELRAPQGRGCSGRPPGQQGATPSAAYQGKNLPEPARTGWSGPSGSPTAVLLAEL